MLDSRDLVDEDIINLSKQLDILILKFYSLEDDDEENGSDYDGKTIL